MTAPERDPAAGSPGVVGRIPAPARFLAAGFTQVADAMLALEAPLRACLGAGGADAATSNVVIASLAAGLALPDAQRALIEAVFAAADADASIPLGRVAPMGLVGGALALSLLVRRRRA